MDCPEELLEAQPEFVHVEVKKEIFYDETEDQSCTDETTEEIVTEKETHNERTDDQSFVFVGIKKEYPSDMELGDEQFVKEEEDIVDVWFESDENKPDPLAVPNLQNEGDILGAASLSKRSEDGGNMSDEGAQREDNEGREEDGRNMNRKRTIRKHLWKRTVVSKNRNEGKCYFDRKGCFHEGKQVRAYNHRCRFKCNEHVDEEKRQEIFSDFWNLGSWVLQGSFLSSSIISRKPKRQKVNVSKNKTTSCEFFLEKHRVCKKFFLLTLDISNRRITTVILKKNRSDAGVPLIDRRGRRTPANKISDDRVKLVVDHIRKFIRYSSPFSRRQTLGRKCEYLDWNLNIRKLHQLYRESCDGEGIDPVTESFYRHVFKTQVENVKDICSKRQCLSDSLFR